MDRTIVPLYCHMSTEPKVHQWNLDFVYFDKSRIKSDLLYVCELNDLV